MKNKIINDLFGKELVQAMREMLDEFKRLDFDEHQIEKAMKNINESVRIGLYLMALERNLDNLAYKINVANKRLNITRKEKFIEAYQKGDALKFLSILGKGDKISLMSDLGIDVDVRGRAKLSKVERDYYTIISNSIMLDQETDQRDGIDRLVKYKKEE
mgnify:CR=1 FL=1